MRLFLPFFSCDVQFGLSCASQALFFIRPLHLFAVSSPALAALDSAHSCNCAQYFIYTLTEHKISLSQLAPLDVVRASLCSASLAFTLPSSLSTAELNAIVNGTCFIGSIELALVVSPFIPFFQPKLSEPIYLFKIRRRGVNLMTH